MRGHFRKCVLTPGRLGYQQGLTQTGMGQDKVVIDLEQRQLIPQARFTLIQGVDPAPDRRYPLAEVEVEAFYKGGINGPSHRPPRPAQWPAGCRTLPGA